MMTQAPLPYVSARMRECVVQGATITYQSSDRFDTGTHDTTDPRLLERVAYFEQGLAALKFDILNLTNHELQIGSDQAQERRTALHDAAALMHMQFLRSRYNRNRNDEFAAAILFNRLTRSALHLDEQHPFLERSHIVQLQATLESESRKWQEDITEIQKDMSMIQQILQSLLVKQL